MSFFLNSYFIYKTSSLGSFTDPYWNNVSLLLHGDGIGATPNGQQNNTFLDSSTNNLAITRSGTPSQGSFSPFALNGVAYSPSLHGGSGYFPGINSNYLSVPSNAGFNFSSGTFTVEAWVYFNSISSGTYQNIVGNYNSTTTGWLIQADNKFYLNLSGDAPDITGTTILLPNTWYHVAASGSAGSYKLFVNGVQEGSTFTGATSLAGGILGIGAIGDRPPYIGTQPINGYISNLRITNGRVCYTTNFTPPTSPVTLTSNGGATPSTAPTSGQVSLLCDFTNGGIFDNTNKNVLTTVGDAKVSTSVVKYGTGAMYFDGTGDYLTIPSSSNFEFGTGDFTVEFWMYPTANTPWLTLCGTQPAAITDSRGWNITITNGSPEIAFWSNAQFVPATIILNQWNYVSVTRSGTTLRMFINGTIANSTTNSQNFTYNQLGVGCTGVGIQPYNGYIDDLRITKGVARYTTAFTPPARAFPDTPLTASFSDPYFDQTVLLLHGDGANNSQNNTFLDSSSNNLAITRSGTPSQGSFSPYPLNGVAYSPTLHGGSLYVGSTSDYLRLPYDGTTQIWQNWWSQTYFTMECWVYVKEFGSDPYGMGDFYLMNWSTQPALLSNHLAIKADGRLYLYAVGNTNKNATTTSTVQPSTWTHIAFVKNTTSDIAIYVNGVKNSMGTGWMTSAQACTEARLFFPSGTGKCYISGYRTVLGSALYTSNFNPATTITAPPTNISGTGILMNFTNGGIFDNTKKNNLLTPSTAKISTSQVKYGTGAMYFDGTGASSSNITGAYTPNSSSFALPNGTAFTMECWINLPNVSTEQTIIGIYDTTKLDAFGIFVSNNQLQIQTNGGYSPTPATVNVGSITANTWTHIAVCGTLPNLKAFINGIMYTVTLADTAVCTSGASCYIGYWYPADSTAGSYCTGYIDDLRITKGVARYTANFTPPARAFPDTPLTYDPYFDQTVLLLHGDGSNLAQNNTFLDSSSNNFAITRSGTPSQGSFSPFALNGVAYSPTLHGGGAYLNGSGDRLRIPHASALNVLSGNFTIEFFIQMISMPPSFSSIVAQWRQNVGFGGYVVAVLNNGQLAFSFGAYSESVNLIANTTRTVSIGTFSHVAVTRNGSTFTIFIDGQSSGTATFAGTRADIGVNTTIGNYLNAANAFPAGVGSDLNAYISNLRIVKGAALYTSTFTPPTSPVTLTSNGGATPSTAPTSGQVSLLCDFTNGGIFDNTNKNVLTTVGDAKVSTSVVKYGTGAMYFDGTGDYLSTINKQHLSLGSENFTIECWVYANSIGSFNSVFAQWPNSGGSVNNSFVLESVGSSMQFYWCAGSTAFGPATLGTITTGSWIHYAICRSGNTLYPFKNGILGTTVSITQTLNSPTSNITVGGLVAGSGYWNGYIDDLRITKGVARYTAAFTPPARAFPDK